MSNIVYPKTIILGTKEVLSNYNRSTGHLIKPIDYPELLSQIFYLIMAPDIIESDNNTTGIEYEEVEELSTKLPNIVRLRDISGFIRDGDIEYVNHHTKKLYDDIKLIINNYGIITEQGFNYCFSRMLGLDVVLDYLPY